jgi:hypothetical protein
MQGNRVQFLHLLLEMTHIFEKSTVAKIDIVVQQLP